MREEKNASGSLRLGKVNRLAGVVSVAAFAMCGVGIASGDVYVAGTLNWSDQDGGLHPMRNLQVEVWETYYGFSDAKVASVTLDRDGAYNAYIGFLPSVTRKSSYLKLIANNGAAFITPDYTNTYSFTTDFAGALNLGTNYLNVNLTNSQSGVFSVLDGLLTGQDFATDVRGATPGIANVKFPAGGTAYSFASGNQIGVVTADSFDWDPVVHEYGHYVTLNDGIGVSLPGPHTSGFSNIPDLGKVNGDRMAFKEGVATWYSIASQNWKQVANNIPTTAPRVGNLLYEDTVDATISYSAETLTGIKPQWRKNAGEGDELTTIRVLWDIGDDSGAAEPKDRIARGQDQVYKDLKAAADAQADKKLKNLSQVWDYYYDVKGAGVSAAKDKWRVDLGSVFEYNQVSPLSVATPDGIAFDVGDSAIPFEWIPQNDGRNDTYQVIVWNSDFTTRLVTTADIVSNNTELVYYSLTAADLAILKAYFIAANVASMDFNFVVTGADLVDPDGNAYTGEAATARYWSDGYKFTLIPEPSGLAVLVLPLSAFSRRRRMA